jgi:hypothetical protein
MDVRFFSSVQFGFLVFSNKIQFLGNENRKCTQIMEPILSVFGYFSLVSILTELTDA